VTLALRSGLLAIAGSVLVVGSLAGCTSDVDNSPPVAGSLPSGTAQITVDDKKGDDIHQVHCTVAGTQTTIQTGDEDSGTTTVVKSVTDPVAQLVAFRNVGGFSGSYNQDLGKSDATVKLHGATYEITGTADGFNTDKPSFRAETPFILKVAC
jgi:hypothetical protein